MVGGRLISYLILWQRRQKNFRRHEKNKNIASATSAGEEEAFAWNKIRTHTHVGWAHNDDDNDEHGPDDELGKNVGK